MYEIIAHINPPITVFILRFCINRDVVPDCAVEKCHEERLSVNKCLMVTCVTMHVENSSEMTDAKHKLLKACTASLF